MPKEIAADLGAVFGLGGEEKRLVATIAARWVGANDVLAVAAGPREPIGDMLVNAARITAAQLDQALALQRESGGRLGEVLIRAGWLTPSELRNALAFQKRLGKGAGERASPLQLGHLLVTMGAITPAQLCLALERQREWKLRLADVLVRTGIATEVDVARALRLQQTLLRLAFAVLLAMSRAPVAAPGDGVRSERLAGDDAALPSA